MIKKLCCSFVSQLCAPSVVFIAERCLEDDAKEFVGAFSTLESAQNACEAGDQHTVSSYAVGSTEGTPVAIMDWDGKWVLTPN